MLSLNKDSISEEDILISLSISLQITLSFCHHLVALSVFFLQSALIKFASLPKFSIQTTSMIKSMLTVFLETTFRFQTEQISSFQLKQEVILTEETYSYSNLVHNPQSTLTSSSLQSILHPSSLFQNLMVIVESLHILK